MATVLTTKAQKRSGSFRSPSLVLPLAVGEPSALYAVQTLWRRGQPSTETANIAIWSDKVFHRTVLVYRRESPLMAEPLEPEQRTKQRPERKKKQMSATKPPTHCACCTLRMCLLRPCGLPGTPLAGCASSLALRKTGKWGEGRCKTLTFSVQQVDWRINLSCPISAIEDSRKLGDRAFTYVGALRAHSSPLPSRVATKSCPFKLALAT